MSTTYSTVTGDTFESVARKAYGNEREALRIRQANPGVAEPFIDGTVLVVPALPGAPQNVAQDTESVNSSEVVLVINESRFRFWERIRITRAIDTLDTLELSAPLDASAKTFREMFRPLSFQLCVVAVGGEPLFTGTIVGVLPVVEPRRKSVSVSAYALPGVLNDCTAPASAFPLEFDGQDLRGIATTIAGYFGLSVVFDADPGAAFDRVAPGPDQKLLGFLSDLAKQRNLVISSNPDGALTFLRSVAAGVPVARLKQGASPLVSVTPFFSPQEYYSHITGIEPVVVGLSGSQFTVKNPRLVGVLRPLTFEASDTISADVKTAVEAKAGRMYGNAVSYSVEVSTWRDAAGVMWAPNTTVTVEAPDAMIYSEYAFIVRNVEFERERNAERAVLNLVLPGAFSGQVPEALPWDG